MTRPVSSAHLTAAAAGATRPAFLVEIVWATFSSRLSTFGTMSWNGQTWTGGGVEVGDFDANGIPGRITLADPDFAYRTLVMGDGVRDRRVNIWHADVAALAAGDPVAIFAGYADGADIGAGRVSILLDLTTAARQFCPRERIGPAVGVNWMAPVGLRIVWGTSVLVLAARNA